VATLDDIRAVLPLEKEGIEGVIVGKALYSGAFTFKEALQETRIQSSGLQINPSKI
jgi:phosphoribosylanthranilate isomerase